MFTFVKPSGGVAFFRSDAEQAEWTQQEMTLLCSFPLLPDKMIERGMVVLFKDPATDEWKAYEIRNVQTFAEQGYQQMRAEDICISELTDCFVKDRKEITNKTVKDVLTTVLKGTGWNVGTVEDTEQSSADIERGSVWDAVNTVRNNWNVNIVSRVTVDRNGISKRYLDVFSSEGVWRGVRLAIDKNMIDPCVTYDDSELYTALYGYGASYTEGEGEDRTTKETTFEKEVWSKTKNHPAKPVGQAYLEDPEKTALYGRNGKARFSYYQNSSIKNSGVLLQKTWEALKNCSEPKISITGTVEDLKRLGYKDQPLRLYDMVIVDLYPLNIRFYKQIIQLTVNLLDPTGNTPTIGDYIPNIIYINRETENFATDGGKSVSGGRGGRGTKSKKQAGEFETNIYANERNIILNAKQIDNQGNILRQAGMKIDPISGVLIYAEDTENNIGSKFRVTNNMIQSEVSMRTKENAQLNSKITQTVNKIELEVSERKSADNALSSRITVTAKEIRSEVKNTEKGLSSQIKQNADRISIVVDDKNNIKTASIVAGINGQGGSYVKIQADKIDLSGYVTASQLNATNAEISNLMNGTTTATTIRTTNLYLYGYALYRRTITVGGTTYNVIGWGSGD